MISCATCEKKTRDVVEIDTEFNRYYFCKPCLRKAYRRLFRMINRTQEETDLMLEFGRVLSGKKEVIEA